MLELDKDQNAKSAEESQMQSAIHTLQQVTEDFEQLVHDLRVRLAPVLLECPKSQSGVETELPETCSVGKDIRIVIGRIRQTKDEVVAIYQNLDI